MWYVHPSKISALAGWRPTNLAKHLWEENGIGQEQD